MSKYNVHTITLDVNNEITRFTSTGQRGDTLINHFLDKAIDANDILDGLNRGYFTTEVIAHITDDDEATQEQVKVYRPEMNEVKPQASCELVTSHCGGYIIKTPLVLETNRSVKLMKTYKSEDLTQYAQDKVGWHQYKATERGLELLKAKGLTFSYESLLS